jgi:hypothetical protein
MDEGLLHLPIQMIEWLISGARIAGMNVWRWAFLPGPAFSRGIEFQECPGWGGKRKVRFEVSSRGSRPIGDRSERLIS